ncbi:glycoside hydrolase family 15 [Phytoactinopolyspora halotolerans]|uniref:Glycoside hydrolase family 15 n=1 Tax=Phytoactinopolyspora halotolerans TaxID=1981512 RepID=A0A6L9S2A9_9ACTN|nr:glycoside hydrolase family 15 [Phytoactinopolyspora halotolerans]NED98930.1 glycoside hydrolase family 15 [Phytoactinopolyspora halotolerans]
MLRSREVGSAGRRSAPAKALAYLGGAAGIVAVVAVIVAMTRGGDADIPLNVEAVGITTGGERVPLDAGSDAAFVPGTRVLADAADAEQLAAEQRSWLEAAEVPDIGPEYADLLETALLDLNTLTFDNGAAPAGLSPGWRHVWPRDAAMVAAALASVGHTADATDVLLYLQRVQGDDGLFHARYLNDGSGGVPDDRGIQLDGTGWMLWASAQVAHEMPEHRRAEFLDAVRPMIDASAEAILGLIDNERSLPPPSSDFWELDEDELTLGTVGPLLAGLESAVDLYGWSGNEAARARAAAGADRLRDAIHTTFGPDGYPRYPGGSEPDASLAFLLPPISNTAEPEVLAAWHTAVERMHRPAGGISPGAGWRDDGVSWTPHTAMYGLTMAATGDEQAARETLTWLDEHRTARGTLPEKVLADGTPAQLAPLSWTAAVVVLTAAELAE